MYKVLGGHRFLFILSVVLLSHMVTVFHISRVCQTVFQSGSPIFSPTTSNLEHCSFPHPHRALLSSLFLLTAIRAGEKCHFVVLICVSLVSNDVEHLFTRLLAICISPLEKCFFYSLVHFKLDYLSFMVEL